ncbi:ribonuclease HI [Trypanosoma cruzi]|nr:ribonuclease HI [Trypanosoma cruzi]
MCLWAVCVWSDVLRASASQASFLDTSRWPKTNCIRMRAPRCCDAEGGASVDEVSGQTPRKGPACRTVGRDGDPAKIDTPHGALLVCGMLLNCFLDQYVRRCIRFCGCMVSVRRRPRQR